MPDMEPITREETLMNGDYIEPITREEMILAGEDIEPITRREWFLKKYRGGGDVEVVSLHANENITYVAPEGQAYSPVEVEVPVPTLTTLEVDENGTYTAPSGTAYNEVEVDVPLPENAYLLKDIPNTPTAIATFTDGSNLPMPKLEVGIEPQQDLHGYDAPWVGGAGKNKCPINESTITGATYIVDTDINIASGTWTFSFESAVTTNCSLQITDADGNTLASVGISNPSRSATVTINAAGKHLKFYGYAGTYKKIQLEEGSIATAFAPYSNICPISGWDEVNVSVSGVNVWDEEWEKGALSNSTGEPYLTSERVRSKNFIPTKPTTAYYFYAPNTYSSIRVACYDKDKNYLGQSVGWLSVSNNTSFITPVNTYYIKFVVVKADETYDDDISINYPSTDTSYHAYNGQTYTIDLDGTRYGGKVDLVSGVMTVDRAIQLVSECTWQGSNGVFYTNSVASSIKHGDGRFDHVISSAYETQNVGGVSSLTDGGISVDADGYIQLKDLRFSTASDFKTNMGTTQLVYKLATPLTIQLPTTVVKSLRGVNNISADSGDVIDGKYFNKEE